MKRKRNRLIPASKDDRESWEIEHFILVYANLPHSRRLECVRMRDRPDCIVRDKDTGEEFGVELTAGYRDDEEVNREHFRDEDSGPSELEHIEWTPEEERNKQRLKERLVQLVREKSAAAQGYDLNRPLLLGVYVNSYSSMYLMPADMEGLVRANEQVFDESPFTEIVYWPLADGTAFLVRPTHGARERKPR